jgi:hypothetical protein
MQFVVAATPTFTTCLLYAGILAGVACILSLFIVEVDKSTPASDIEIGGGKK